MIKVKPPTKKGPPDGGYGWVIVISAAIGLALITGLVRVAGFTYVEIIKSYKTTRADTSIVFMTVRLLTYAATPIVSKLTTKYNYSSLMCSGGIILFAALFLSSFTTQLWQLVLTYGVLIGVAATLIITPGLLAINTYFKKRRALAISLYFTIGGASGLIIPFMYEILLDKYTLAGAFLVYSGISLNLVPFGTLIRKPDWLPPKTRRVSSIPECEIERPGGAEAEKVVSSGKIWFRKMLSSTMSDLSIFKDPVFLVLLSSRVLVTMPLLNIIQFIPDFVDQDLQLGLDKQDIALLLSATSIGDICARLLTGTVIDKLPWPMKYTFAVMSAGIGAFLFVFVSVKSYALLVSLHVVFGLLLGIILVMQYILEVDLMGVEKTPLSHGITQLLAGLASVITMYLVGYFRDVTGSYRIGFYLMGVCGVLSGLVWLLEPCLVRCLPLRDKPRKSIDKFPEGNLDTV